MNRVGLKTVRGYIKCFASKHTQFAVKNIKVFEVVKITISRFSPWCIPNSSPLVVILSSVVVPSGALLCHRSLREGASSPGAASAASRGKCLGGFCIRDDEHRSDDTTLVYCLKCLQGGRSGGAPRVAVFWDESFIMSMLFFLE